MSEQIDPKYTSLDDAKYYAIVYGDGDFAFRFGPFEGPAVGKILERCLDEDIPLLITADCGPVFDWELAGEFRGKPDTKKDTGAALLALLKTTARVVRSSNLGTQQDQADIDQALNMVSEMLPAEVTEP